MKWLLTVTLAYALLACAARPEQQLVHSAPFRFVGNQILLEAHMEGQGPYTFLLDTGVTPSVVDAGTAQALELAIDESGAAEATGAGARQVRIVPTRIESLTVAGTEFGALDAVTLPMEGLSRRLGEPLHGILGVSFLAGRIVTVDYFNRLVTIGPRQPDPEGYQFPLVTAPDDIMPLVQISVAGHPFTVSIDTGSSFGVEIFDSALADIGLEETVVDWETQAAEGARGAFETKRGRLSEVLIGPFRLNDVPGVVTHREGEQHRQGNIGNALLSNFVVTFDYVERVVTLRPNGERSRPR